MPRKKKEKDDGIRRLVVPENATDEEIYARYKAEFTAADLQKYTVLDEPTMPMGELLIQMERIHEQGTRKKRKKKK